MNLGRDKDYDYLDFGGDSDDQNAESSEDELDIILHGTPEQRRRLQRHQNHSGKDSSSEDDFEKEMNAELQETMNALEAERRVTAGASVSSSSANINIPAENSTGGTGDAAGQFYDDIYFDSDEDEDDEEEKGSQRQKSKRKHPVLSNDDLLYDPNMDDEDQRWVNKQREKCCPKIPQTQDGGKKSKPLNNSDAVLNCPACMTTLCMDCQRHDLYQNQYRAMFVMNCSVDTSELLKYPKDQKKKRKKKSKQKETENGSKKTDDEEKFNPVRCTECNTVVAMYDTDEVYHFFNILTSYS